MQNPLKALGDLNSLRKQALEMQKALAQQQIVVEEGDVRVVITGDQRITEFSVQGVTSDVAVTALNKAIKKSQEMAAQKLQEMTGGLGGMLGGR
jgi:DNA-binding protein YbaB